MRGAPARGAPVRGSVIQGSEFQKLWKGVVADPDPENRV